MLSRRYRPFFIAGLSAALPILSSGCGDQGPKADDAIVEVNEPGLGSAPGAAPAGTNETTAATPTAAAPKAPAEPADAPTAKVDGWGTLKGRVVFVGDPPAPKVAMAADKMKDPQVCAVSGPYLSERLVVDPKTKGVKNAIVYIPQPTAVNKEAESEAKARTVVFDQKGCVFEPHVIAVMEKSPVTIKSSDPVGHNVNIKLTNNAKNFTVPSSGNTIFQTQSAERAPGQVVCDIHTWMTAWWYISKNPYFAVTDAEGNFEIKNVPAGTQKVVVWQEAVHPKLVANKEAVNIKPNETTTVEYKLDPAMINQ